MFYNVLANGYEWKKGDVILWTYLQSAIGIKQAGDPYDINLIWKYND